MATLNNISIYKGEAITLTFTMSPVTDITGWTITLTIRTNATDAATKLTKTASITAPAANGVFTFPFVSADTKTTLGVGTFAYDVQRVDAGSEAVLSIGTFFVLQEVLY